MNHVLLRITYRLQAHNIEAFEKALKDEILPLIQELGIKAPAVWRTFLGDAGEYMELWEFESFTDFEQKWRKLTSNPRLHEIFQTTGPMVLDEKFSLFDPLENKSIDDSLNVSRYSV